MSLTKASTRHVCKRCHDNIYIGFLYYPQRRNKALCVECAKPDSREPKVIRGVFISWLLKAIS